jgi:hypothetical protein
MCPSRAILDLKDSALELVKKLSLGHPGAIVLLTKIVGSCRDPYSLLLDMDDLGLTGPRIWEAYKEICGEDIEDLVGRVRARTIYN